jgi:hypothetical protein
MPSSDAAATGKQKPKGDESDEEVDAVHAGGDHAAAARRAADPAHRKQLAAELRDFVRSDLRQMQRFKLASLLELEHFIPRCCRGDDVLYRFALSRAYDLASASKRYYSFCDALNGVGMASLTEYTEDVAAGVREGWILHDAQSLLGHPVMSFDCGALKWRCTVKQMCHATIFICWRQATMHGYAAQIDGADCICYMQAYSMGLVRMEYETWSAKLFQGALPMKFARMYLADEAWSFGNILWPMMKFMYKKKLRERIIWLNVKASGKAGDGKTRRYEQLVAEQPPANIAATHGGGHVYDAAAVDAEFVRLCRTEAPPASPASQ